MYLSPDSDLHGSHRFSVVWGILSPGTEEILLGFAPFAFDSLYNGILEHTHAFSCFPSSSFTVTGLLAPEK